MLKAIATRHFLNGTQGRAKPGQVIQGSEAYLRDLHRNGLVEFVKGGEPQAQTNQPEQADAAPQAHEPADNQPTQAEPGTNQPGQDSPAQDEEAQPEQADGKQPKKVGKKAEALG